MPGSGEKTFGSLASCLLATGKERGTTGKKRRLFGQDQLVFAGDAQQVELPGMVDFKRGGTLQQCFAVDTGARAGWRCGGGLNRGWWCELFHLDANTNENGYHFVVNENRCQRDLAPRCEKCCIRTNAVEYWLGDSREISCILQGPCCSRKGGGEFVKTLSITKARCWLLIWHDLGYPDDAQSRNAAQPDAETDQ